MTVIDKKERLLKDLARLDDEGVREILNGMLSPMCLIADIIDNGDVNYLKSNPEALRKYRESLGRIQTFLDTLLMTEYVPDKVKSVSY